MAVCIRVRAGDFTLAQGAGHTPVLVVVSTPAPVGDCIPVRVEDYIQVLAVDFTPAPVGDCIPVRVELSTRDLVVASIQDQVAAYTRDVRKILIAIIGRPGRCFFSAC